MKEGKDLFTQFEGLVIQWINTITASLELVAEFEKKLCEIFWIPLSNTFNLEEIIEKISQNISLKEKEKLAIELINHLYSFIPKDSQLDIQDKSWYYGNNFYVLFSCLLEPEWSKKLIMRFYLNEAKKYWNEWKEFLEENRDTIDQVLAVIKKRNILGEVYKVRKDLLKEGNNFSEEEQDKSSEINAYLKKEIDPLLQELAKKMKNKQMNPEKFFS